MISTATVLNLSEQEGGQPGNMFIVLFPPDVQNYIQTQMHTHTHTHTNHVNGLLFLIERYDTSYRTGQQSLPMESIN